MVGGCIRVNQNNGRYAWHRITMVKTWVCAGTVWHVTFATIELTKDFKDGNHFVWNEEDLLDRMCLTGLIATKKNGKPVTIIGTAKHWEHDVLEDFVEQYYVHIN